MLVLQPRIWIPTDWTGLFAVGSGETVSVGGTGGVSVATIAGVSTATVDVAIMGVELLAPGIFSVAVTMEGVRVGGRKGVGALYPEGWKNQPLQEVSRKIVRDKTRIFFISSPSVIVSRPE
jgi:hypothetical protein